MSGKLKAQPGYVPLSRGELRKHFEFGPHHFSIRKQSHERHMRFLQAALPSAVVQRLAQSLTPFETWPLARALAAGHFVQLNEVVSASARWLIFRLPATDTSVTGKARVASTIAIGGLAYATFFSQATAGGTFPFLQVIDTAVLLRDSDRQQLRRSFQRSLEQPSILPLQHCRPLSETWDLQLRFSWNATSWPNNIHTSEYAAQFTLPSPLVEAPALVDIVFLLATEFAGFGLPLRVEYRCRSPLLQGMPVRLFEHTRARGASWRLSLATPLRNRWAVVADYRVASIPEERP